MAGALERAIARGRTGRTVKKKEKPVRTVTSTTGGTGKGQRSYSTSQPGGKGPKTVTTFRGQKAQPGTTPREIKKAGPKKRDRKLLSRRERSNLSKTIRRQSGKLNKVPSLSKEQEGVLHTILKEGKDEGATKKEKLAAVETGLVESNLMNLAGGDADSAGWRQERASLYPNPTNVKASAERFFEEAKAHRGTGKKSGEVAADVQRPAEQYRGRYREVKPRAAKILKQATKPRPKVQRAKRTLRRFGERPKAKAVAPRKSKRTPSVVHIGNVARDKFGLSVRENPAFDPVDPVHTAGSFHYQRDPKGRGQAIDVSGDSKKLAAFNKWAAKKYGKGLSELFYDPGINIKDGQPTSAIGGHGTHVHVAVGRPGSKVSGGVTDSGGATISAGSIPSPAITSVAAASGLSKKKVQGFARRDPSSFLNLLQSMGWTTKGGSLTPPKRGKAGVSDSAEKLIERLERKYGE